MLRKTIIFCVFFICKADDETSLACSTGILIDLTGSSPSRSIESPKNNISGLYPPNSNCSWTIEAPLGKLIRLRFDEFDVEPSFDCDFDVLLIYQDITLAHTSRRLCSRSLPNDIISESRKIKLVFISDEIRHFKGFKIQALLENPKKPCEEHELTCRNGKCVKLKTKCNRIDNCGDGTDEENCKFLFAKTFSCGKPKFAPDLLPERIVGGSAARKSSWPWQVSLRIISEEPYGHKCGASLINDQWLLTAAHCFNNKLNSTLWIAVLGKHFKVEENLEEQRRYLKEIHIHPNYNPPKSFEVENEVISFSKENDIALIRLNAPVTFTDHVRPICLPSLLRRTPKNGKTCYVTGWGETLSTGHSNVLKQASVPILKLAQCQKMYKGRFEVTEKMICAGKGGDDACQGDSGGPLVAYSLRRWYQVGVVSFGGQCGQPEHPGVYTKLTSFQSWIKKTIKR